MRESEKMKMRKNQSQSFLSSYPSLSSRPLAAAAAAAAAWLLAGGEVSMASWLGLSPREDGCPGLESELS